MIPCETCYNKSKKSKDLSGMQQYRKIRNNKKQKIRNSKIKY